MISVEGISKSYGGQVLFRDLSWRIADRERIGLVGPNGAGKTTICRILAGVEEPDTGRVSRGRSVTVGYLPQEVAGSSAGSVLTEALAGFEEVWALEREMETVAHALETTPSETLTARYGELQHRFEALGGYGLESRAKAILSGLGFRPDEIGRSLGEFSGGWRMRAALARLLLLGPSLLLLDEPTNHLDLEALAWLESFLADYDGTVVVVSHDRYFLNRMVTSIAALGPSGLVVYPGDYDDYLVEREARQALLEAQARNQAKRIEEIERFIERFRYKATKARQVQSRIKMLAKVERIEVPGAARRIHFTFPEPPRTGRRVATLSGVHKAYGDNVVYAGIDLAVERGDRVALVGENGAGKSTLLKILAGVLPFDRGERVLGAHVAVHYYAQHQLDALTPANTVLDEIIAAAPDLPHTRLRSILGAFLFSGDAVDKRVSVLSGGEKARLALARMLVRPAALLCLDEPTNHLDLASREVLEEALATFPGTIVFISHDRYFINRIATSVLHVERGRLTRYLGTYDDFLSARMGAPGAGSGVGSGDHEGGLRDARRRDSIVAGRAAGRDGNGSADPTPLAAPSRGDVTATSRGDDPTRSRRDVSGRRGESSGRRRRVDPEVRELRRRLGEVERRVEELEAKLAEIAEALADPALYADGERARAVAHERKSAEEQLAWSMREWEEISTALAAHEA